MAAALVAAALTGTETSVRSPEAEVCTWAGPNEPSRLSPSCRRWTAAFTCGEAACPSTTICTGLTPPAVN